ncbi:hypothetical protein HYW41_03440 [Candidatus Daviesbacteria bacterium]|nr:hypothetical protein [Candidatus Daviesbacteria bacterium]
MKSTLLEVAKDVKDAVGEMIEQGVQSVAAPQLTPKQIQQKQGEDQKQILEARRKIAWYQKIDEEQKKVRAQSQQKEAQRLQSEQRQEQAEVQQTQIKQVQKQATPEEVLRTQIERKAGKGLGG